MATPTPTYPNEKSSFTSTVYGELIELLVQGGGPEAIIAFRSSDVIQDRAYDLIYRERDGNLTDEEKAELDAYVVQEHIIRMAKARARLLLKERQPS